MTLNSDSWTRPTKPRAGVTGFDPVLHLARQPAPAISTSQLVFASMSSSLTSLKAVRSTWSQPYF